MKRSLREASRRGQPATERVVPDGSGAKEAPGGADDAPAGPQHNDRRRRLANVVAKRRKTSSRVWQFFSDPFTDEEGLEWVTCKLCDAGNNTLAYCGTTSNMYKHLRSKHKAEYKEDLKTGDLLPVADTTAADTNIVTHTVSQ